MEMSISANHASTAALSQLIKPQANVVAQQTDNDGDNDQGTENIESAASDLLTLNTQGSLGRQVNQLA